MALLNTESIQKFLNTENRETYPEEWIRHIKAVDLQTNPQLISEREIGRD